MANKILINNYLYCVTHAWYIRLLGFVGLSSSILCLYGFTKFLIISPWYLAAFGPFATAFAFNRILRYSLQLGYPKFDIPKHKAFIQAFWKHHAEPSVDVLLPYAGEDETVFEETLKGVSELEYTNTKAYILDDKGSDFVKALADKYGFTYLSRSNKGEYRKAGNLRYGYANSQGEFVLVLDADFIPASNALHQVIPYIVDDEKMGILQTPQYFEQTHTLHKTSHIQFGGGNVVEEFYKIDQPCRDRVKGGMCVGTSAIYRRKAVEDAGGTPKVWGTEDVRQGLLITQVGYYVKYLPIIISIGDSPETVQGYFRQHNRWCTGSLATIFGEYYFKAKLTPLARLTYLTNAFYYITEAASVIMPFQLLALMWFQYKDLNIVNSLWFLPYFLFIYIISPLSKTHKPKFGTYMASLSNNFTYLYTIFNIPIGRILPWEPAGVKTNKIHKSFHTNINLGLIIVSTYIVLFIVVLINRWYLLFDYNAYVVLAWCLYSLIWSELFLFISLRFIKNIRFDEMINENEDRILIKKGLLHIKYYLLPILTCLLIAIILFDVYIHTGLKTAIDITIPKTFAK